MAEADFGKYLAFAGIALGTNGLTLLVVRLWFADVRKRLDRLNGFKERMLENHITRDELNHHEDRCSGRFSDLGGRVKDLERGRAV